MKDEIFCKFCGKDIADGATCDCNYTGNPYATEKKKQRYTKKRIRGKNGSTVDN